MQSYYKKTFYCSNYGIIWYYQDHLVRRNFVETMIRLPEWKGKEVRVVKNDQNYNTNIYTKILHKLTKENEKVKQNRHGLYQCDISGAMFMRRFTKNIVILGKESKLLSQFQHLKNKTTARRQNIQ